MGGCAILSRMNVHSLTLVAALGLAATAAAQTPTVATPPLPRGTDPAVLLITSAELAQAWMPFAEWKTRGGKPTRIVSVAWIAETYPADSIQESIRRCVRDHVENRGTRWIVLGGDCNPAGSDDPGPVPGGHTTVHRQERQGIPTDIVYLSPTDWDANGNGVLGEWPDDKDAITYPDGSVGLGRIPVRTAADVAAFTDKVVAYESAYPDGEFAEQMVYTCTDAPAYPKVRKSWDAHVSAAWNGRVERFFSQETPWDGDQAGSHDLSPDNLVALLGEKRRGKLHIHGHGMLPFWVLETGKFTAEHVGQLDNGGAYPLITTVSCFTGQYDGEKDPSIVEAMLRQPNAGSVAIVAPVRTGKPHFHNRSDFRLMVSEGKLDGTTQTMTRYWVHGLGDEAMTTGHALMQAKADMGEDAAKSPNYHLCICELNLLGDPTLDMRRAAPRTPALSVRIEPGFVERILVAETGEPTARVCVWRRDELYEVIETDDEGTARLPIGPNIHRLVRVAAFGPSLNTVVKESKIRTLGPLEVVEYHKRQFQADLILLQSRQLLDACKLYQRKNRRVPQSVQDLIDAELLAQAPEDPWGSPYVIEEHEKFVRIISAGPDGEAGTDDDIDPKTLRP